MIFQTSMVMFHVNLPGSRFLELSHLGVPEPSPGKKPGSEFHGFVWSLKESSLHENFEWSVVVLFFCFFFKRCWFWNVQKKIEVFMKCFLVLINSGCWFPLHHESRPFSLLNWFSIEIEVSVAALGGSNTEHTFVCGYQPGWVRCVSGVSVGLKAEVYLRYEINGHGIL